MRLFINKTRRGSMIPLFLIISVFVVFFTVIMLDLFLFYINFSHMRNIVTIAEQSVATPANAMIIKNSDNPQLETANIIKNSLDENRFKNNIKVWAFEYNKVQTGDDKRLMIIGIETSQPYKSIILEHLGVTAIKNISYTDLFEVKSYAPIIAWRPENLYLNNGLYTKTQNDINYTFELYGDNVATYPEKFSTYANKKLLDLSN